MHCFKDNDTDSDSFLISKLIANDYTFRALALRRLFNDLDYSGSAILLFHSLSRTDKMFSNYTELPIKFDSNL